MADLNTVLLIGNLCRDPELRQLTTGTPFCELRLAVNRRWRNQQGEDQEDTVFLDVEVFGRQAETMARYLSKGRAIMVDGRLRYHQWQDQASGENRSRLTVIGENIQFLDSAPGAAPPA